MENEEPSRNDAAKQEARNVEYEEKTEQLLEFHGQEKVLTRDPTMLLGALGAYLLFVGTVAAVGALASSSNHKTTSEIFLFASALLVLIVPLGVIWYFLRVRIKKKPSKKTEGVQGLLGRIMQNPIALSLARFANKPVVRFFNISFLIFQLGYWVLQFPLINPRFSLAIISAYTILISMGISLESVRWYDKALQIQLVEIWEFNKLVQGVMGPLRDGIVTLSKQHQEFAEAQVETNDKTLAAIVELNRFVRAVANIEDPDPLDAPPKNDEPNG